MRLLRRTYCLPSDLLERFERVVPYGHHSPTIAQLMQKWLEEHERSQLRDEIAQGCHEMSDVHLELEAEYHPLEEEVERKLQ